MSNCTQEFQRFVPKAMSDPERNPRVLVIDCAEGGQAADLIKDPNAAYWDTVASRLRGHGSSPAQVQAVWIKEANRRPKGPFPESADTLLWNLGSVVRNVKGVLPNVKLTYLTSRIYAGYATTDLNPEPFAYESGFAVKWLIDAQIQGIDSLNYDPAHGSVQAPWLAWGPYLWADGLEPRSDGFTWPCADFAPDGTHPGTLGQELVADSLLAFFKTDETTAPWFLRSTTSVPVTAAAPGFTVSPNPSRNTVTAEFSATGPGTWRLAIVGPRGNMVRTLGEGADAQGKIRRTWDGSDRSGRRAPPGAYWVRLDLGDQVWMRRIVRLSGN